MIKVCTECGKSFECLYPDIWVYKRFPHYYCTWKCYRKEHNEMARLKKDGTPAKKPGPKKNVTVVDTVPAVKLSGPIVIETPEAMAGMKDAADTFFGKCEKMGLKLDDPKTAVTKPLKYDGFEVRAVSGVYGTYHYSNVRSAYIDYETHDGDELSMTVEQWRGFLDELHRAALVLGVEL